MNPTIESWNVNWPDVGPIYPFLGGESLMFAACVAFFVAFLIWKFRTENAKYATASRKLREPNELHRALTMNSTNDNTTHDADQHQE